MTDIATQRVEMIEQRLNAVFNPSKLTIIDDSHKHAGHASAGGAGHFTVQITAKAFSGKTPIQRHRLVYDAVNDIMQTHIHALSIQANSEEN